MLGMLLRVMVLMMLEFWLVDSLIKCVLVFCLRYLFGL